MRQYIIFKTNSQSLGIGIEEIEKIIEFEEGKKMPESLAYIMGVIEYNDSVLPVVDLSKRIYNIETKKNMDTKIIVINWKGKHIGLAVEDILGIKSYDQEYEKPIDELEVSKEYVEGFIKLPEDIIIVLDVEQLFNKDQEDLLLGDLNITKKMDKQEAENNI